MSAPQTLRDQQRAFANHLRDPQQHPAPEGLPEERLAVYRRLFFNNILGLLGSNFPVIRATLGDVAWHALVQTFYADHAAHTPLFPQIGRELVDWLQQQEATQPPWLAELAHYEWVELALQISDEPLPPHAAEGDLLDGVPMLSPWAWPLAYQWPVHRIGPQWQPDAPPAQPTLLLARRDTDGRVRFSELSPLVFRLLQLLDDREHSGRRALQQLAHEAAATDSDAFLQDGIAMLQRLHDEGTLLGCRS